MGLGPQSRCATTTTCVQAAQREPGYALGHTPLPQSNAQHVLTQGNIRSAFHTIADVKSTWLHWAVLCMRTHSTHTTECQALTYSWYI